MSLSAPHICLVRPLRVEITDPHNQDIGLVNLTNSLMDMWATMINLKDLTISYGLALPAHSVSLFRMVRNDLLARLYLKAGIRGVIRLFQVLTYLCASPVYKVTNFAIIDTGYLAETIEIRRKEPIASETEWKSKMFRLFAEVVAARQHGVRSICKLKLHHESEDDENEDDYSGLDENGEGGDESGSSVAADANMEAGDNTDEPTRLCKACSNQNTS